MFLYIAAWLVMVIIVHIKINIFRYSFQTTITTVIYVTGIVMTCSYDDTDIECDSQCSIFSSLNALLDVCQELKVE